MESKPSWWPWWKIELDCSKDGAPKIRFSFKIQAPDRLRAEELAFEGVEAEYHDVETVVLEPAAP